MSASSDGGYDITGVPAGVHLGLPSGALTFIVSIDEPLYQYDAAADSVEAPSCLGRSPWNSTSG